MDCLRFSNDQTLVSSLITFDLISLMKLDIKNKNEIPDLKKQLITLLDTRNVKYPTFEIVQEFVNSNQDGFNTFISDFDANFKEYSEDEDEDEISCGFGSTINYLISQYIFYSDNDKFQIKNLLPPRICLENFQLESIKNGINWNLETENQINDLFSTFNDYDVFYYTISVKQFIYKLLEKIISQKNPHKKLSGDKYDDKFEKYAVKFPLLGNLYGSIFQIIITRFPNGYIFDELIKMDIKFNDLWNSIYGGIISTIAEKTIKNNTFDPTEFDKFDKIMKSYGSDIIKIGIELFVKKPSDIEDEELLKMNSEIAFCSGFF